MKRKTFAAVAALTLAVPLTAMAASPPSSSVRAAFAGAVTSASSTSLTVDVLWSRKGSASGSVTVAIDPSTKIVYGKGKSSISPGDLVRVVEAGSTARRIHVDCDCHFAAGTLGSVGSSSFAVNVSRTGPYDTVLKGNAVTFQVGSSTVFVQGKTKAAGSISGLKTGEKVGVIFAATGFFKDPSFNWQTATFTASHVRYAGALQPAPINP